MSRKGGVFYVIGWARLPRSAEELFHVLESTRDEELLSLMRAVGGPSGHIAWAEYGRRHYGVDYGIEDGVARPYVVSGGPWH